MLKLLFILLFISFAFEIFNKHIFLHEILKKGLNHFFATLFEKLLFKDALKRVVDVSLNCIVPARVPSLSLFQIVSCLL